MLSEAFSNGKGREVWNPWRGYAYPYLLRVFEAAGKLAYEVSWDNYST